MVGVLRRERDSEMNWESEGIKCSQTVSDSAAEQKVLETRESLRASMGVVPESMAAMHPSGNF